MQDDGKAHAVSPDSVRHRDKAGKRGVAELIKEHIDGKLSGSRHTPHAGVEHAAEKEARPEAIVFGVLSRDDLVHDGLLLADRRKLEAAAGGQLHHVPVGEGPQGRQSGQREALNRLRVSSRRSLPFIKEAPVFRIVGVLGPSDGEVIERASIAAEVLKQAIEVSEGKVSSVLPAGAAQELQEHAHKADGPMVPKGVFLAS